MSAGKLLVFSVLMLGSFSACAVECFQKSPNFIFDGDAYYELETSYQVPLEDQREFIGLAQKLEGSVIGEAHRVECVGPEREPRLRYEDASIKGKLQASLATGLLIHSELANTRTKVIKAQLLAFLGKTPSFQFFNYGNGHFSFAQKSRRAGVNFEESIIDIQFTGVGIVVKIDHYLSGVYYATDNVELVSKP